MASGGCGGHQGIDRHKFQPLATVVHRHCDILRFSYYKRIVREGRRAVANVPSWATGRAHPHAIQFIRDRSTVRQHVSFSRDGGHLPTRRRWQQDAHRQAFQVILRPSPVRRHRMSVVGQKARFARRRQFPTLYMVRGTQHKGCIIVYQLD